MGFRVWGSGCRVCCAGFRVWGFGCRCRLNYLESRVLGVGFRVWDKEFGVQGMVSWVWFAECMV